MSFKIVRHYDHYTRKSELKLLPIFFTKLKKTDNSSALNINIANTHD